MRIIAFCGHPLNESVEECEDLGKRLRRNNVALDVINFANPGNKERLQAIVNTCNNDNNSHFLDVEPGSGFISGVLFGSAILNDNNMVDVVPSSS